MSIIAPISRSKLAPGILSRSMVWGLLIAGLIANLFGIVGGSWDGAYHARYIVDTFWSPPHLLLYSGMGGTMLIGLAILTVLVVQGRKWGGGMMQHNPLLLITVLANLGFLATGPFDELWHSLFGRDTLTVWTAPHFILNLNLALTALGVVGLAVWLRAAHPNGSLVSPLNTSSVRNQNLVITIGLSMLIIHMWGFLSELEWGDTTLSPIPGLGWLYPLVATLVLSLCLAFASQLLPKPWWMAIPLVILAQLWWVIPGVVLRQFGYEQVDGFRLSLTLAGFVWAVLVWNEARWAAWLRFALFGLSYIGIVVIIRLAGYLPVTSNSDILLTAIFLPLLGIVGGFTGTMLGAWLQGLAGEL
jgi:hypothetical protein